MQLQDQLMNNLLENMQFGSKIRSDSNITDANKYALDAREKNQSIRGTLAQLISQLDTDLSVERSRIDQLSTLEEGSTTGDAELIDMRVGVDGTTYSSAGEALRSQLKNYRDVYVGASEPDNGVVKIWVDTSGDGSGSGTEIAIPQINDAGIYDVDTWSSAKINDELSSVRTGRVSMENTSALANGFLRDILAECNWEVGGIDATTGDATTYPYMIRSTNYVTFDFVKYACSQSHRLGIFAYNSDGVFLECINNGLMSTGGVINGESVRKYKIVLSNASQGVITYPAEYIRNSGITIWSEPKPHLICNDGNELYKYEFNMNAICSETGDIVTKANSIVSKGYIENINRLIYVPDGISVKLSAFNDSDAFLQEEIHDKPFLFVPTKGNQYVISIYWTTTTDDISEYTINRDYFLMKSSIMVYPTDFGLVDLIQSMIDAKR